jgi:hypothetical protein
LARAVYTISHKPLSKDFFKILIHFKPAGAEGTMAGAETFLVEVVCTFMLQLPFKMPPGSIEMIAA